jgi:hypothetical protein
MRQFACFRIHRPGRVGAPRFVISRKFMRNNLLIFSNGDLPALTTNRVGLPFPSPHWMTLRRASFSTLMQVSLQNVDSVTIFRNFRFQRFS